MSTWLDSPAVQAALHVNVSGTMRYDANVGDLRSLYQRLVPKYKMLIYSGNVRRTPARPQQRTQLAWTPPVTPPVTPPITPPFTGGRMRADVGLGVLDARARRASRRANRLASMDERVRLAGLE
jgi:hypothetical protein